MTDKLKIVSGGVIDTITSSNYPAVEPWMSIAFTTPRDGQVVPIFQSTKRTQLPLAPEALIEEHPFCGLRFIRVQRTFARATLK